MLTRRCLDAAAKAALKRKKAHEHSLEQTLNHIGTLESQIYAIESANINQETFVAMKRASEAMKAIHGKLTPEKVDETMYVLLCSEPAWPLEPATYTLNDPLTVWTGRFLPITTGKMRRSPR